MPIESGEISETAMSPEKKHGGDTPIDSKSLLQSARQQNENEHIQASKDADELINTIPSCETPQEHIAEILQFKNTQVLKDFYQAKQGLRTSTDPTISKILAYPDSDEFLLSIIKHESNGELKRNVGGKRYFGYGQISKDAQETAQIKLGKKLNKMRGVENCMIMIGYLAVCRDILAPYVQKDDLAAFALVGYNQGPYGIKKKILQFKQGDSPVSWEQFVGTYKKITYPNSIAKYFRKLETPKLPVSSEQITVQSLPTDTIWPSIREPLAL